MTQAAPLLDVQGLSKRFGGVLANDRVDLQVAAGEIHALIGPNGAGKTTLVAQLAGELPSDAGRIVFDGADITSVVTHQRARRGLVRSFQLTRLFRSFTVLDNVALALQAVARDGAGAWRHARDDGPLYRRAHEVLAGLGLAEQHGAHVDALSHGEQRALEVGLALASRPRLVLLDEPMAGTSADESVRMERLIDGLRETAAVVLIEHDVDAVFRLADRVSVLVQGRIMASGPPAAIRGDRDVIAAYLGEGHGDPGSS